VLAYFDNLASRVPAADLPDMKTALLCFCAGVLAGALAFLVAYFTQLRLYYEEHARHEGNPFTTGHSIGITIGTLLVLASAIAFGAGCWIAAITYAQVA
jgi:CHASE2 domain-containing sensor protein